MVTESWPVQVALDQALAGCGLAGEVVGVGDALRARDRPIVLFHAERWDSGARRDVERLAAQRARVLVVSRDARAPVAGAAILASGADVAESEDEDGMRRAAHVAWLAVQGRAPVWRLGRHVFDVAAMSLRAGELRIALSPTETRILRRLCGAAEAQPNGHLVTAELTSELRHPHAPVESRRSSVRNYIRRLRLYLEEDPEHPRVLPHDADGYWVVLESAER